MSSIVTWRLYFSFLSWHISFNFFWNLSKEDLGFLYSLPALFWKSNDNNSLSSWIELVNNWSRLPFEDTAYDGVDTAVVSSSSSEISVWLFSVFLDHLYHQKSVCILQYCCLINFLSPTKLNSCSSSSVVVTPSDLSCNASSFKLTSASSSADKRFKSKPSSALLKQFRTVCAYTLCHATFA